MDIKNILNNLNLEDRYPNRNGRTYSFENINKDAIQESIEHFKQLGRSLDIDHPSSTSIEPVIILEDGDITSITRIIGPGKITHDMCLSNKGMNKLRIGESDLLNNSSDVIYSPRIEGGKITSYNLCLVKKRGND